MSKKVPSVTLVKFNSRWGFRINEWVYLFPEGTTKELAQEAIDRGVALFMAKLN